MSKGLAPVFFTACGVVVAGVIGYSIIEPNYTPNNTPGAVVQPVPDAVVKALPDTKETTKLEEPKIDAQETIKLRVDKPLVEDVQIKPIFELVRVEKDGSTVIAGTGEANQIIELLDGDQKLADTKANSVGEFVFVLDKPLEPGAHELFLRMIPKNGKVVISSSFAFVDVPKPNKIGEVTVLLAEAGKPSQILQKSQTQPIKQPATPKAVAEINAPEPIAVEEPTIIKEEPVTEIVGATAKSSVSLAKPKEEVAKVTLKQVSETKTETPKPAPGPEPEPVKVSNLAPVLIEAADIEAGKIFIAGKAEPRTSINLYLGNDLLGETQVADNGAFLFEGVKDIKSGRYDIRADMTKGGTSVLARAEVALIHEPKVAKTPKPVLSKPEENTAEPETQVTKAEVQNASSVESETPQVDEIAIEPKTVKKEIETGAAVIIRRGDNLWTVARRNYGAGIRYTTIFDANRDQVRNPHRIYPGQVLKMPEE